VSALSKRAAEVEAELGAAWTRYHVRAQLARLAAGVLGSVLWAVLHGGVSDWTGLLPVATIAEVRHRWPHPRTGRCGWDRPGAPDEGLSKH
jgi:hypothetical protein